MKTLRIFLLFSLPVSCSVGSSSQGESSSAPILPNQKQTALVSAHATYLECSPSTSLEAKQVLSGLQLDFNEALSGKRGMNLWISADLSDAQYLGYSMVDLIRPDSTREVWLLILSDEAHELEFCNTEEEQIWSEPQRRKIHPIEDWHTLKFELRDDMEAGEVRAPLHLSLKNKAGHKILIDV